MARRGEVEAEPRLMALLEDAEAPAIVRATAASLLAGYLSPRSLPALERALVDPDPVLRAAAARGLEVLPSRERLERLGPLLDDPVRLVRIDAARALASLPANEMSQAQRGRLSVALAEYRSAQLFNAERPEAWANLGILEASRGDLEAARPALRKAIEIDPGFLPAYVNLADVYRLEQRDDLAEGILRDGLAVAPEAAALHHALGLLLVRRQATAEALVEIERAAILAPDESRYAYVYGVALNSAGDTRKALAVLADAHRRTPADRELLWALATISRDDGAVPEALDFARKLRALSPGDPGIEQLIAQLEQL